MLTKAKEGKYAVGQFNINNLEWTKAILQTAQENNSPVILGVSEGAGKYIGGWDVVVECKWTAQRYEDYGSSCAAYRPWHI